MTVYATTSNTIYLSRFQQLLLSLSPDSVADIGGPVSDFAAQVRASVPVTCVVSLGAAEPHPLSGTFPVVNGSEDLFPLEDDSVDLALVMHVAHRCLDWPSVLTQSLRIARRGVLVIEDHYDPGLPSQVLANHLDGWSKAIDRRVGVTTFEAPSGARLARSLVLRTDLAVTLGTWLDVSYRNREDVDAETEAKLAGPGVTPSDSGELQVILGAMDRIGLTRPGAVWMQVLKR